MGGGRWYRYSIKNGGLKCDIVGDVGCRLEISLLSGFYEILLKRLRMRKLINYSLFARFCFYWYHIVELKKGDVGSIDSWFPGFSLVSDDTSTVKENNTWGEVAGALGHGTSWSKPHDWVSLFSAWQGVFVKGVVWLLIAWRLFERWDTRREWTTVTHSHKPLKLSWDIGCNGFFHPVPSPCKRVSGREGHSELDPSPPSHPLPPS